MSEASSARSGGGTALHEQARVELAWLCAVPGGFELVPEALLEPPESRSSTRCPTALVQAAAFATALAALVLLTLILRRG